VCVGGYREFKATDINKRLLDLRLHVSFSMTHKADLSLLCEQQLSEEKSG
jgi:hypothetical protein